MTIYAIFEKRDGRWEMLVARTSLEEIKNIRSFSATQTRIVEISCVDPDNELEAVITAKVID